MRPGSESWPLGGGEVKWLPVEPCYVFHVGNAREDGSGRIILDAVRYTRAAFKATWARMAGEREIAPRSGGLYRWTIDPRSASVRGEWLDDRGIEFPTLDDRRTGGSYRFLYAVAQGRARGLLKYDLARGAVRTAGLGGAWIPGEAVFVPRTADGDGDGDEDGGWLLTIVAHARGGPSRLVVLDARDLSVTAQVHLPRRVPLGFHGAWIPDHHLVKKGSRGMNL